MTIAPVESASSPNVVFAGYNPRMATERLGGDKLISAAPEADDVPQTLALLFDELERFVDEGEDEVGEDTRDLDQDDDDNREDDDREDDDREDDAEVPDPTTPPVGWRKRGDKP